MVEIPAVHYQSYKFTNDALRQRLENLHKKAGLASTLGNGTMTNDLVEFATDTDVFLLIGTNTSECHPIIAMQMQRGLQRGAKMIVVDPK